MERRYVKPGEKFGTLTIIRDHPSSSPRRRVWCRCDCGDERDYQLSNLTSGNTKTCGLPSCSTRGATLKAKAGYLTPGEQARGYIFSNYKSTAEQKGREWQLSFEDFTSITSKPCAYCGAPPSNHTKDRNGEGVFVYSGIDRVDPLGGYTLDNVVPACIICNRAKTNLSIEAFRKWVARLVQHMEV